MSKTKDGIKQNGLFRRVEPLVTVKELKERFLFGVLPIVDNDGNELTDDTLQSYIDYAVSMFEHDLDIAISPIEIQEEKDYYANDYYEWGYFQLNNIPVIEVESIEVTYLRDGLNQPENVLDIPQNWIRLREHDGIVRLVPNNRFPARLQINAAGSFFPELFRRHSNVPQLWTICYTAGFKDGKIPAALNMAIGLTAAIMAMNIAGDLVLGAGIASQSLSIDGLSQSINTTSSAENHAYSAKNKEYQKQLYGGGPNSPDKGLLKVLRDYYQGQRMYVL